MRNASSSLTSFAERTGAMKPELAGPVPVSLSDLPTVAVKLDPERTLPMEPVILAQLCAQTQISARRRILPMGHEYSVHVEFTPESLPQAVAPAPVAPAARGRRAYLLQLLALILGPLLGLGGGAGLAWHLSRPAPPHRPGVRAAPRQPSKQPATPLPPPRAQPASTLTTTAPAVSPPQSPLPASVPPSSQPERPPAAASPASPASSTQVRTQPSSRPSLAPAATSPASDTRPAGPPVSAQPARGKLRSLPASAPESQQPGDAPAPSGGPRSAGEGAGRRMPAPEVRAAAASGLVAWYRPLPALANLASGLELDPSPPGPTPLLAPPATSPALLLAPPATSPALLPVGEPSRAPPQETTASPLARPAAPLSRSPQRPEQSPAPRYLSGEQPRLPLLVRQMYHRETVVGTYRLCVNPSGAVAAVTPVAGIPFDEEIQRSLRSWRFAPRATAVCIDQELHFKIDE